MNRACDDAPSGLRALPASAKAQLLQLIENLIERDYRYEVSQNLQDGEK